MQIKHFLQFNDFSREEYEYLFERSALDQTGIQAIPALLAVGRPYACHDF